jgi:hypothetical protein
MNDDVRNMIYATIVLFLVVVASWLGIIYVSACGLTFSCRQAIRRPDVTPIPTLIPAVRSEARPGETAVPEFSGCPVNAADLIGAWVTAGVPETEPFPFTDLSGTPCEATFADIHPLFVENSLWYKGGIGCVSCHNAALGDRSAGLDLTSYDAILLGSRRVAGASATGTDILGSGNWESSLLHKVLVEQGFAPEGHSAENPPVQLIIYAGQSTVEGTVTATPTP